VFQSVRRCSMMQGFDGESWAWEKTAAYSEMGGRPLRMTSSAAIVEEDVGVDDDVGFQGEVGTEGELDAAVDLSRCCRCEFEECACRAWRAAEAEPVIEGDGRSDRTCHGTR